MIAEKLKYFCKYYDVGFFVFVEFNDYNSVKPTSIEPIIEVSDEIQGKEFIYWLSHNNFVTYQITNVSNDNLENLF